MAVTTLTPYTPVDRRAKAFSASGLASLQIQNPTSYQLLVLLGRNLQAYVEPGQNVLWQGLANITELPGWLVLIPRLPTPSTTAAQLAVLGAPVPAVLVTTYTSAGDPLPPIGSYYPGVWTVTTQEQHDAFDKTRGALTFNARDFGAVFDGIVDDRPAIQAALDVCGVLGGTVELPDGQARVTTTTCPTDPTFFGALFIYSNTCLKGHGPHSTELVLDAGAANQAGVLMNAHISHAGGVHDANLCIQDLSINGNAANVNLSNTVDRNRGIWINSGRDIRIFNVRSRNCLGASGGANGPHGTPAEGHHIVVYASTDVLIENCVVFSDDGGPTGTGIGVGDCEAARVIGCVGHDMQFGWGISTYDCSGLVVDGCNVYSSAHGIFTEICTDVTIQGCTVGGTTPFNNSDYYPLGINAAIGVTVANAGGISSRGTINLRVIGCHVVNCQQGLLLQNETSPARNQANTVVVGCRFSGNASVGAYNNNVNDVIYVGCIAENNGNSGFYTDTITSGRVVYIGCTSRGNTNYGFEGHGSTSQYILLRDCQASGNTVNDVFEGAANPIHGHVSAPAVGASPFTYTNVFSTPIMVYLTGGNITAATQINGVSTGINTGQFLLYPGDTITVTWTTTAPTWTFFAV